MHQVAAEPRAASAPGMSVLPARAAAPMLDDACSRTHAPCSRHRNSEGPRRRWSCCSRRKVRARWSIACAEGSLTRSLTHSLTSHQAQAPPSTKSTALNSLACKQGAVPCLASRSPPLIPLADAHLDAPTPLNTQLRALGARMDRSQGRGGSRPCGRAEPQGRNDQAAPLPTRRHADARVRSNAECIGAAGDCALTSSAIVPMCRQRRKKVQLATERMMAEARSCLENTTEPLIASHQDVAMAVVLEGDYDSKIERQNQHIAKQTTVRVRARSLSLSLSLAPVGPNSLCLTMRPVDSTLDTTTSKAVMAARGAQRGKVRRTAGAPRAVSHAARGRQVHGALSPSQAEARGIGRTRQDQLVVVGTLAARRFERGYSLARSLVRWLAGRRPRFAH